MIFNFLPGSDVLFALLGVGMVVYLFFAGSKKLFGSLMEPPPKYEHLQLRNMEDETGLYHVTYAVREPGGRHVAVVKKKWSLLCAKMVYGTSKQDLEYKVDDAYKELKAEN